MEIKEIEKRDVKFDFDPERKNLWNTKVMVIPIVIGALGKKTGKVGNWWTNRDHSDYSMVKIYLDAFKTSWGPK